MPTERDESFVFQSFFFPPLIFIRSSFTASYAGVKRRQMAAEPSGATSRDGRKTGFAKFWALRRTASSAADAASQPPPLCCHGDGSFHFLFISPFIYFFVDILAASGSQNLALV